MSPITTSRPTTDRPARRRSGTRLRVERTAWTCSNCQRETLPPRKRCAECGTSRY